MPARKSLLALSAGLSLILLVSSQGADATLGMPTAHAQDISVSIMTGISIMFSMIITGMNVLMWIFFELLTILLDPQFIFDTPTGGAEGDLLVMLRKIWQLSRDVVNLCFAFVLIAGGIMVMVSNKIDKVKEYMPKFALAVILVNFSWFIPRVVLDISQVVTYTVFQLPSLVEMGECKLPRPRMRAGFVGPPAPAEECEVIVDVAYLDQIRDLGIVPGEDGWKCPDPALVCYRSQRMSEAEGTINAQRRILNGLIINHARLKNLASISDANLSGELDAEDRALAKFTILVTAVVKLIIVMLIHVAMFFPMVALVAAFFIRIPVLWITIAFMPFVALGYVIGDKLGEFNPVEKIWKTFVSMAFLPAMAGVPIAVGFVLINAGSATNPPAIIEEFDTVLPIFSGIRDLWQLIWMLMALFILWTGVFSVLSKAKIVAGITDAIKSQGEAIGRLAYKAPLNIPIIPGPGGKDQPKLSPMQIGNLMKPTNVEHHLDALGRAPSMKDLDKNSRPDPKTVNQIQNTITNNQNLQASLTNKVDMILNNANNPAMQQQLAQQIRDEMRGAGRPIQPHENTALAEALAKASGRNAQDQREKLKQAMNLQPPSTTAPAQPQTPPANPTNPPRNP